MLFTLYQECIASQIKWLNEISFVEDI